MRHFFGSVFVQEDDHIELEYYIQENGGSYGIEIKSSKPTHSGFASYSNITTNYDEIVNFTQCLMENSAYGKQRVPGKSAGIRRGLSLRKKNQRTDG